MQRAVEDARDGETAEIVAVVEIGDENLQRAVGIAGRSRNVLHDRFEQRTQIAAGPVFQSTSVARCRRAHWCR